MKVKDILAEDFCNYKVPSMFIITSICDWKCCTEQGLDISICQNQPLVNQPTKDISDSTIYDLYINNPITKAIVIGGLEPMLQFGELWNLIKFFRTNHCNDPFVIYTGYNEDEIENKVNTLVMLNHIIIKFGRYVPNRPKRFDDVLGIELVSDNQYAVEF